MKRQFPLHIHISTLFLGLVLLVGGTVGWLGYQLSRDMLDATATDLMARVDRETQLEFQRLMEPAEIAVRLFAQGRIAQARSFEERMERIGFLRTALDNSATLSSLYVGHENGDFFLMRRLRGEADRVFFAAPPETRYIVQSIDRPTGAAAARGLYLFLADDLRVLHRDARPDYASSYDPRTRGWYQQAHASDGRLVQTPPYLFFSNRKVGTTQAMHSAAGDAVVGADILLETLGSVLTRQKLTPGTQIALIDAQGQAIAHENVERLVKQVDGPGSKPALARLDELGVPVLNAAWPALRETDPAAHRGIRLAVAGADWRVTASPIALREAAPLRLVIAVPESELMATALALIRNSAIATGLIILLAIPLTWMFALGVSRPLRALAAEADAIRHFEFSKPVAVASLVTETNDLAATMDGMKRTIRRFLDINMVMAAENDFARLLPRLLKEMLSVAQADKGVLFLADDDGLIPVATLEADGSEIFDPLLPVAHDDLGPLLSASIKDGVARAAPLQPEDTRALGIDVLVDPRVETHALAVPLLNRRHELVGAMLLLHHAPIDDAHVAFVEALSGSAAISLETHELIKAQKELFEALVKLIAGAIDAKSPYTGGHCERVPELTKMLARAACEAREGPYADFALSEEEWEAIHIAAWLHDCGKVTTPEYVVDKATKLETIHDRIHEVRMRFEVLKRDAEIAYWQGVAAGGAESALAARRDETLRQLDDDFAFVAACNEGGEFMAPEKVERLGSIAARTWRRTLDDRIGIAHEEKERKARTPAPALPVDEPLLADKPEHLFHRNPRDAIAPDNPWGFRMAVPELLYNRGEVYNLAVGRGTLSEEERFKINEHIVQTIMMLTRLPFPKHLRKVPEIAGGHHEKMDGTGYPKRLKREEMSPVARMMAIADIFEALTAVDRPYKKGKTLSEAVKIMSFMKKDQHIDPDLFDLFLRSGVYREYAERFMKPEQIDAVPLDAYLNPASPR